MLYYKMLYEFFQTVHGSNFDMYVISTRDYDVFIHGFQNLRAQKIQLDRRPSSLNTVSNNNKHNSF